ncbi:MFS sugar transporter [Bacillus gaemokensis]|uniref:MFS sugar transporter n=2 Tax=Bacillus gaemokensis TaxID=574375 RepID=A0A073K982_9BACI|nr:MFS sugar transporter [Bacillus gaemokensis]KYG37459.1 MFS sugar transporter [Bacillus gaemokensis]
MMNTRNNSTLALLTLAISAFTIGVTEFISVCLLPLISNDLDVSVSMAGLTVTIYALGVTIGAPILTSLTAGIPRKKLLLLVMLVFIIGNGLSVLVPNLYILLIGRTITSFTHGVFMSIGSLMAASLVSENKRAQAISIMFSGLTIATITGVPIGTFIGIQFGWRMAFLFITIIGVIAYFSTLLLVPKSEEKGEPSTLKDFKELFTNTRLLFVFIITAFVSSGTFTVFTYLSPLLQNVTKYSLNTVTIILFLYGIMIAVGNLIGGKVTNTHPLHSLSNIFIFHALVLLLLYFTVSFKVLGLITVMLMGLFAFMNVPGLQLYTLVLAERISPKTTHVASAINIASFNIGIATGSYIGSIIIKHSSIVNITWVGSLLVLIGLLLTQISKKWDPKI